VLSTMSPRASLALCVLIASGLGSGLGARPAVADDDGPLAPVVHAHAARRTTPIAIDGHLDEEAWVGATRQRGFSQRFPKDGGAPTLETSFAVLYDDHAIYVAVWADDPEPAKIRDLLTRRDVDTSADFVAIGFDSYHDRRTAYCFQLNAAGVERDFILFDDSNQDASWDAVWQGDTAIGPHGWTAEFRIPLSQLRYATDDAGTWGFQIVRNVARLGEQSAWSPWPRSTPQIVSRFGALDGLAGLPASRRLELQPYASGGVAVMPVDAGDPLHDHVGARHGLGLDLKYGLGSAFTLSASINPDFGQVEADPSQVNLSANELFFAERRPFFLEGVDLFQVAIGAGDNNAETAFYSRRIGAAPHGSPDGAYVKVPTSTEIYGAAKLSGKTVGGWSIGVLDAVTRQERAEVVDEAGAGTSPVVEPLTNYLIGRIKRDFRDGKTSVGASVTAVDRALADTALEDQLHDQAYTGGLQLQHRFLDDRWSLDLRSFGSWVHGSAAAIAATQRLNRHDFQRPDATDVHFDPTRRSLAGYGTSWGFGRNGDVKHWRFLFGGEVRSPGLEMNDAGYQTSADHVVPFLWGQYREDAPSARLLNWNVSADAYSVNSFEARQLDYGIDGNAGVTLANYWSLNAFVNLTHGGLDPRALRGGPALRTDATYQGNVSLGTDGRKAFQLSLSGHGSRQPATDSFQAGVDVGATIQARSNLDVFVGPSYQTRDDATQFVAEADDAAGHPHQVLARIVENVVAMTVRVNWTFSPHLSFQGYAQPFVASGRYSEYKEAVAPRADQVADRFHVFTGREWASTADQIAINRDGVAFGFDRPDFNVRQLRSTLVLRWEYRPGSTVFAIWSHGRSDSATDGRLFLGHDLASLARADGEHVVMVKANYWIGL
jgi:hypothetical protein